MQNSQFNHQKQQFLKKIDKSRKGSIDKGVLKLVNIINKHPDMYTTSSCSGRTMLIASPEKGRKCDSEWIFTSHEKITFKEIKKSLEDIPKEPLWFKKEGMIIHVCCRTIKQASRIVDAATKSGFKRSGILAARRKILVEINDTEKIELPIAIDGGTLVDDDYLRLLVRLSNEKHDRTKEKIRKLEDSIKTMA